MAAPAHYLADQARREAVAEAEKGYEKLAAQIAALKKRVAALEEKGARN